MANLQCLFLNSGTSPGLAYSLFLSYLIKFSIEMHFLWVSILACVDICCDRGMEEYLVLTLGFNIWPELLVT